MLKELFKTMNVDWIFTFHFYYLAEHEILTIEMQSKECTSKYNFQSNDFWFRIILFISNKT